MAIFIVFDWLWKSESGTGEDTSFVPVADSKVPVASWEYSGNKSYGLSKMIGDTLYFIDGEWDESQSRLTQVSIFKKLREAKEAEIITELGEAELIHYFADETENLYCLYRVSIEDRTDYYIRKLSFNGEVVFDTLISYPEEAGQGVLSGLGTVFAGEATGNGEICLGNLSGDLYLLDKNGQFVCTGRSAWNEDSFNSTQCGLVNAGKAGIYAYHAGNRSVTLQRVVISDGKLESAKEVRIHDESAADHETKATMQVFNGYDMGVLVSDSDSLWKYDVSQHKLSKIISWGDSSVNLKNYMIDAIGILQEESFYIFAHRTPKDRAFVQIDYREGAELPVKKVVTMAKIEGAIYQFTNSELEVLTSVFNQSGSEFTVEFQTYASVFELHTALLKGEGPDLFDFGNGGVDISVLARKGVLENLSPYFSESKLVKEENLLPSILNAGKINGELVCVFPTFSVNGLLVEKGTTNQGGWTPEDYLAMGEKYPEAVMADHGNPAYYLTYVLKDAVTADMQSYVNWDEGECYFDSERFVSLVERIKDLKVPVSSDKAVISSDSREAVMDKFLNRELLTETFYCGSMYSFYMNKTEGRYGGDYAELAGYPNESALPYYLLDCNTPLGMNAQSQNKEGAWAFLEFLLSKQYQSDMTIFPVRVDSFDEHMKTDELYGGYVKIELSQAEKEFIRYMVDHAYWTKPSSAKDFSYIITEETEAVWAGDKQAEEAAKIIQSRIKLFISEQS